MPLDTPFRFALADRVAIMASGEDGTVVGRAEYTNAGSTYLVRYRATDGRAIEAWWAEDALVAAAGSVG
jgi:hypothetical protein